MGTRTTRSGLRRSSARDRSTTGASVKRCCDVLRLLAPAAGEATEIVGRDRRLICEQQHHGTARGRQSGDAGADRAREPLAPLLVDDHRAGGVLEERCELRRSRAEHDDKGITRHLRGAGDRRVQQRSTGDTDQLLGRAEACRGAGSEHDRIQAIGHSSGAFM